MMRLSSLRQSSQQLRVQLGKIACRRHGNPVVAPEVAAFTFHAALLVAFAGRAEVSLILPVRAEGDEASRLLAPIAAQDLLHRARQVVVAKPAEDAAEVMKRQLVGFQKRLLRGSQIGAMIGRSTGHRPHLEHLELDPLAVQIGIRFIPVDLRFHAPVVALRHEGLQTSQSPAPLCAAPHTAAPCGSPPCIPESLRECGPRSACRVTLLPRGLAICFQNRIDELDCRRHLQMRTHGLLASRRDRALNRLTHHPPMDTQLPRHPLDRAYPKLVLQPNLLEQLHLGSPVQLQPPDPSSRSNPE